ncbi:hypothetical protein [Nitrosococcus wardiae]|nr:hypothetical protein [Nitrosococcus wardiae]
MLNDLLSGSLPMNNKNAAALIIDLNLMDNREFSQLLPYTQEII